MPAALYQWKEAGPSGTGKCPALYFRDRGAAESAGLCGQRRNPGAKDVRSGPGIKDAEAGIRTDLPDQDEPVWQLLWGNLGRRRVPYL